MRQITNQAIYKFDTAQNFSSGNTRVEADKESTRLYLHNNLIAKRKNGYLFITNAGWESNTTKERLNGLTGVSIHQKNFQWYLNDKPWNGEMTEIK